MNFARKARMVARRQWRRGQMSREDFLKVRRASRDPKVVAEWEAQVKRQVGAPWETGPAYAIDWHSIWEWFIKNWPAILKILLTLLVFVEVPEDADEPEDEPNSGD